MGNLFDTIFALMNFSYGLAGKAIILAVVLAFFLVVNTLIVFFNRGLSPRKVKGTIAAALLGYVFLLLDGLVRVPPPHQDAFRMLFDLVVLFCSASLVNYLVVDVYFYNRMDRRVPSYKRDLTAVLVYALFGIAALRFVFRLDIGSIITTTTVLTAAVAFAMQSTLSNIVSSFYVQNDLNLRNNTWISLPEHDILGQIVNVGFRYTTLRTMDNQHALVPNSHLNSNIIRTLGGYGDSGKSAVHTRVGLGYDMPPEKAADMLHRILLQEAHILKDPPPNVLLTGFLDSSVEYDLKYYLDDYSFRLPTQSSILKKVWYAVGREGYSIPFPHREVLMKTVPEPSTAEKDALPAVLERMEILKSLRGEEIRKLAAGARILSFGPGEEVVRQGDEGDSLFIVRRGTLDVRIDGAPVGTLGEGSIFGEMSLLTGERRTATVCAATEVRLAEISREDLEPVIRANPALLESLSAILAERQARNVERMKSAQPQKTAVGKEVFLEKLKIFFGLS